MKKLTNKVHFVSVIVGMLLLVGISGAMGESLVSAVPKNILQIKDVPQEKWDNLANKKIFFGHQSVGYNIITGIEQILKEYPNIKLKIVKTTNSNDIKEPVFAHDWIGSNMNPESKTRAFSEIMQKGVGDKVDIAFMKMCYVDVTSGTNVEVVFDDYKQKMSSLDQQFPDTEFVHVTIPLTAKPEGTQALKQTGKNIIKKIMGRTVFDYKDNINRNKLNAMLKSEYAAKSHFFDLALLESTDAAGVSSFFSDSKGEQVLTLSGKYTSDGGHLNAEGSRQVAEQLLVFLANLQ